MGVLFAQNEDAVLALSGCDPSGQPAAFVGVAGGMVCPTGREALGTGGRDRSGGDACGADGV